MTKDLIRAFVTVFPAELPDKTMLATVVLVARFRRPLWVWVGAVAAFSVHVVVAVSAGGLLSLLPGNAVDIVVATMFAIGAGVLVRAARNSEDEPEMHDDGPTATPRAAVFGSFGLIIVAEWGDLTQIATAGLAAKSGAPVATAIGALAALASVAAIAAAFGRKLVERVPLRRINYLAAAIFAGLAIWTIVEVVV